jgi:hypothetical protein
MEESNKAGETSKVIDLTEHLKKTIALNAIIEEKEKAIQERDAIIEELKSTILSIKEFNVKLAHSVKLYVDVYFTKDEKIAIAQEIDRAITDDQVKEIYTKYKLKAVTTYDTGNGDYVYSPKFVQDLDKHYFQAKAQNPFETIYNEIQTFHNQLKIEEEMKNVLEEGNSERMEELKIQWENNRAETIKSLENITNIVVENYKK